ncbi:MAG TPA: hypothetical protein EYH05_17575, partial [Anaerolineae bacterium]|nr:hypothetical protein [Anaerolineae bacterium]
FYEHGDAWYQRHFEAAEQATVIGEFSTSYLLTPEVPKRMADLISSAKLLFIFRNPIERAYSNYWFSLSIGTQSSGVTFSEAIRNPEGYDKYVAAGFYYQHLESFLNYYDRDQIYIMITEDLQNEPLEQMATCYQFLGVDANFQPDVKQKYNTAVATSNPWIASTYRTWITVKNRIKPTITRFPSSLRRNLALLEKQATRQLMSQKRPPLPPSDREYLQNEYQPHNARLADFLGKDLPYWE